MENQSLDDSRPRIPSITLGCWAFDTAPGYGNGESERVLGVALKGRRDEALIIDKVAPESMSGPDVQSSCEESLARLQTDRIDILLVHWPSREVATAETCKAMLKLKEEGKVRYIGVCNCGMEDMTDYLAGLGDLAVNQLPYSLLCRAIEFEILPECLKRNVPVLAYSPLMQGLLTGKFKSPDEVPAGRRRSRHFSSKRPETRHGEPGFEYETFQAIEAIRKIHMDTNISMTHLALLWVKSQLGVESVIVGARNEKDIVDNAAAFDQSMSAEIIDALNQASSTVKTLLGKNPDLWERGGRYR